MRSGSDRWLSLPRGMLAAHLSCLCVWGTRVDVIDRVCVRVVWCQRQEVPCGRGKAHGRCPLHRQVGLPAHPGGDAGDAVSSLLVAALPWGDCSWGSLSHRELCSGGLGGSSKEPLRQSQFVFARKAATTGSERLRKRQWSRETFHLGLTSLCNLRAGEGEGGAWSWMASALFPLLQESGSPPSPRLGRRTEKFICVNITRSLSKAMGSGQTFTMRSASHRGGMKYQQNQ